jgi:hypothetical protein
VLGTEVDAEPALFVLLAVLLGVLLAVLLEAEGAVLLLTALLLAALLEAVVLGLEEDDTTEVSSVEAVDDEAEDVDVVYELVTDEKLLVIETEPDTPEIGKLGVKLYSLESESLVISRV